MLYFAWLLIFTPIAGSILTPVFGRINPKLRDYMAVAFSLAAAALALLLLPAIFTHSQLPMESQVRWLVSPIEINFGIYLDATSIIIANVVAVISSVIMIYCVGYMKGDPGRTRFFMWMNLFIGSMLLLVLANNLLFLFIGWKLVGVCSYGLIGYYYRDERKYWLGGPPPTSFVKPSAAGIKALVVTGVGDMLMLAGILIVYYYSHTLNIAELYATCGTWIGAMSETPGMIIVVTVLLLMGPIGKSAQFPLHEWLPEAMAGPGPVSALIHAATMVKSGVYLVARLLPLFYYAYHVAGIEEAAYFFTITAWIGAFTAFLAATQGMVALELKKVLAYSTVSQIGYMMLGMGVAGLSSAFLVEGYASGLFHLVSHALFKACLFLCAGTVIHAAHSFYMSEMGGLRRHVRITMIFMTIAALSLMGFPPMSGFWSKDAILLTTLSANMPLFILALITVALTSFYTVRFMGMVFFGQESRALSKKINEGAHVGDGSLSMLTASGILAVLILAMSFTGPYIEHFMSHLAHNTLVDGFSLPVNESSSHLPHWLAPVLSIFFLAVGAVPAFYIYVLGRKNTASMLKAHALLNRVHGFLWNRWHIEGFYENYIKKTILGVANWIALSAEEEWDTIVHKKLPKIVTEKSYLLVKALRTDRGETTVILAYILIFFMVFAVVFLIKAGN